MLLRILISDEDDLPTGILTPVPSYSSFNTMLADQGAIAVPYYLCEEQGYALPIHELKRAVRSARRRCNPRVLYIINPGNTTGKGVNARLGQSVRFCLCVCGGC